MKVTLLVYDAVVWSHDEETTMYYTILLCTCSVLYKLYCTIPYDNAPHHTSPYRIIVYCIADAEAARKRNFSIPTTSSR
jgi:hypothetical protein